MKAALILERAFPFESRKLKGVYVAWFKIDKSHSCTSRFPFKKHLCSSFRHINKLFFTFVEKFDSLTTYNYNLCDLGRYQHYLYGTANPLLRILECLLKLR